MERFINFLDDLASRILTSPWFWRTLAGVTAIVLLTLAYRKLKLRTIQKALYERGFSTDGVFVGEELELIETIRNPSWFPLFSIKMVFFMPSGLTVDGIVCDGYTKLVSIFNIPPFSTVRKVHTVKANKRDHYRLFYSNIKYRSFECTYNCPTDFYAYPNRYDADASFSPDLFRAGEAIADSKYIEDPFFLSGIRAYRPGDPMRAINFKASVRSFSGGVRQLMCNDYDSSRNYDSMIFLDLASYSEAEINSVYQVELGLRYACYLFCESISNGGSIGFATNCSLEGSRYMHVPCGSSDLHTKHLLECFAEISPYARRDYSISAILQSLSPELPRETDIYLITSFVDDKTAQTLHALRRMGRSVSVITLRGGEPT